MYEALTLPNLTGGTRRDLHLFQQHLASRAARRQVDSHKHASSLVGALSGRGGRIPVTCRRG